jgi:glyoxylase-like metal-dependent hydrolase (beta-lactamase superfamily II)
MRQIAPGLHYFTGLVVGRVYLIEDPDGLTIVDTGLSLAANRVVKQLRSAGHKPRDVKRILITHAHPDHVGGLPKLKAVTGAQVLASAIERPVIEGKIPVPRPPGSGLSPAARLIRVPSTRLKPTPVDREIAAGETLDEVMGGLEVVFTPGHAPGHLSFWQPGRRILFCGDVLMNILGLRLPLPIVMVDMDLNKRSIGRLAELEPSIICFGHGNPLKQGAARKLRDFARRVGPGK